MIQKFENTEVWEDKAGNILASWHRPTYLFSPPISLHSPSTNYKVYPFESLTLSPFEKMLRSWYPEFVHIHVFMGIHETINNQEDLKHEICFKLHPFNNKNIAYKNIQPEICFGKL